MRKKSTKPKVLLVDDSMTIREGLRRLLEGDYEVSAVQSGVSAIRAITLDKPDLVLLDRICEDTPDCMENSLKVHVSNLRRKLKEVTGKDYMEAVWGIGFKMREM